MRFPGSEYLPKNNVEMVHGQVTFRRLFCINLDFCGLSLEANGNNVNWEVRKQNQNSEILTLYCPIVSLTLLFLLFSHFLLINIIFFFFFVT